MKIIPAIDLKGGKCVRLYKGDFNRVTEYGDDPLALAAMFAGLQVDDLHVVDLDGARSGTQENRSAVAAIASRSSLSVQLGGGIRDRETVAAWLDRGVARCVVGSLAVTEPATVRDWLAEFGGDSIVIAMDVDVAGGGEPMITTHGWTRASDTSLWDCIEGYRDAGLTHVLCTDVSRDGAMQGPNVELYASIVERYPDLQLQASGGVRNIGDMQRLRAMGIPSAITGRALLDGEITKDEVASFRQSD